MRGENRHRVPAPGKPARQALGVDGQPAGVRAIVRQDDKDVHNNSVMRKT